MFDGSDDWVKAHLPLAPEWMPVWLILANTVVLQLVILAALWWQVVRKRPRRHAMVFAILVALVGVAEWAIYLELFRRPSGPVKSFYYRLATPVAVWSGPPRPVVAVFRFLEDRTALLDRPVIRKIAIYLDDGSAGSLRGVGWPETNAVGVETPWGYVTSQPLLDDLWPLYSLDERGFDDCPEAWDAFCRSQVVRSTPALAWVAALDTRTLTSGPR